MATWTQGKEWKCVGGYKGKMEESVRLNPEQMMKHLKRQEAGLKGSLCLDIIRGWGATDLDPHGACICRARACFSVLGDCYEEE